MGFFFNSSSGGLRERIGRVELISLYWSWGLEKTGSLEGFNFCVIRGLFRSLEDRSVVQVIATVMIAVQIWSFNYFYFF